MYSIQLNSVYSYPAEEIPEKIDLPEGWQLSWHQLETWKALQDPTIDVVFNTAMTGDGKSLAAYLPVMTGKNYTMAMYPTNELARDQERQVQQYKDIFGPSYDPQIYRLTGATLENFIETHQLPSKQQGILNRSDNSEILLTNPDIFHYIHDFRYLRRNPQKPDKGDNPDKLFGRIDKEYKIFLFDEFHIFSSPQVASVLNALLLIKHTSGSGRKFLFLSATPNELLEGCLKRSSLNYKIINPIEEKKYQFSATDANGWRQISQPISLHFPAELQPGSKSGHAWILENAEEIILKFFLDYPDSKGAIILNSIASVYRLVAVLKPLFGQHGLTVLPNTSLTGESERARSVLDANLLIGTSTIDVGVDFRINFLIFEAADAGNFIQRFESSYRYFCPEQVPLYEVHLTPLNRQGIYVTPARAVRHTTVLNTWKYADNRYHVEMHKTQKNIPSFGRAKEIAPESQFEFFAFSEQPLTFPRWIRLGKWMSKAAVNVRELSVHKCNVGREFTFPYPLNPLDVMFTNHVLSYDTINMPPVSLIRNVRMVGDYYSFDGFTGVLPAHMEYRFSS